MSNSSAGRTSRRSLAAVGADACPQPSAPHRARHTRLARGRLSLILFQSAEVHRAGWPPCKQARTLTRRAAAFLTGAGGGVAAEQREPLPR